MKMTSRYALLAALGVSVAASAGVSPAFAAKKKEEAQAAIQLSNDVRPLLADAQKALGTSDTATAQTKLAAAKPLLKTPDDNFFHGQLSYNLAIMMKDQASQSVALDQMIASGRGGPEAQAKLLAAQGQFAYQAKNYAKAEQSFQAAIAAGNKETDIFALLADTQARNGRPAEALATLQKSVAAAQASGQTVPNEFYARGADIASRANLAPQFVDITAAWLAAYPTKQNLHDTIFVYRQMAKTSGDVDLDLLRLARHSGVLALANQNAYLEYAEATYLRYPAEAAAVLKEGLASGKIPAASKGAKELLALAEPKVAGDKASLNNAIAGLGKASFTAALNTGDAFASHGDYAKAAEAYKIALTKSGGDAGVANVRLGAALFKLGDKEGARAAFKAVTGPEALVARFWLIQLDRPAV